MDNWRILYRNGQPTRLQRALWRFGAWLARRGWIR
jgi:hypothetical protein